VLVVPGSGRLPDSLSGIAVDRALDLAQEAGGLDALDQLVASHQDRTVVLRGSTADLAGVLGHITNADPDRFVVVPDSFSVAEVSATGRGVLHVLNWGGGSHGVPVPTDACRVHLLRHGQAMLVEDGGQVWSHHPIGLTERGKEQAGQAAERLRDSRLAAIYTSPLERAAETAAAVAAHHGQQPLVEPGLIEIALGDYEGMTLAAVHESGDLRYLPWLDVTFNEEFPHEGYHHAADLVFPGGESILVEHQRVLETMQQIVRRHQGESIAVVSHTWAIQPLLAYWTGGDPGEYYRFGMRYATDTVVDVPAAGPGCLVKLNANINLDDVAGRRLTRTEGL
jgi:broad specificity phosphatase PhoE